MKIGADVEKPDSSAADMFENIEIFIPLKGVIDVSSEIARLQKELDKIGKEIQRVEGKLKNQKFLQRAPEDIVKKEQAKHQDFLTMQRTLRDHLEKIQALRNTQ